MNRKTLLLAIIILTIALSVISLDTSNGIIHAGGFSILKEIALSLLSPEISADIIQIALRASLTTLVYAFAGMSLAIAIGFIFGTLSSNVLFRGRLGKNVSRLIRSVLGFMRAIHELVWAWLFVASIGLSPLSGVFALAIPYGGILGRIYADMLSDVPKEPISSLESSGSSRLQTLFYGHLPFAMPNMISYTMYRLECSVRSSAILSFVGLGGLGYEIQISLQDLNFNRAWTFVLVLIIMVVVLDIWSNMIRKRLL